MLRNPSSGKSEDHSASAAASHTSQHMMPVMHTLNGYTSDHTIRAISVSDNQTPPLVGGTWNLMNQCHGLVHSDTLNKTYSNNPFHADESIDDYRTRKLAQVDYLIQKIQSQQYDFMFLQEVDFLQEDKNDPGRQAVRTEILDTLKLSLNSIGYDLVTTQHQRGAQPKYYSQQPLITIYNTNRLTYQNKQEGQLANQSGQPAQDGTSRYRYRAFEALFNDVMTGQNVALTNLHLDYANDYTQSIEQYMKGNTDNDIVTIMGGDTNHSQNNKIHHLIIDWHHASNIDSNDGIHLSDLHENNTQVKKSYDGFMVAPSKNHIITATELESEYFEISPDAQSVNVKTFNQITQYATHASMPGRPWQRNRFLAEQIDREYGQATAPNEKQRLLKELTVVVSRTAERTLNKFHQKYGTLTHVLGPAPHNSQNRFNLFAPSSSNASPQSTGAPTNSASA